MPKLDLRNIPPDIRADVQELERRGVKITDEATGERNGWKERKAKILDTEVFVLERQGSYKVAVSAVPQDVEKLPTLNKEQAAKKLVQVALEVTKDK